MTTTNAGEDVAKQEHYWWECNLVQPLWKAVLRCLKKIKIELLYDPVVLLLGIYLKQHKSG
jgi:predicted alpha-1,6-mannanase (GH76 family)